MNSQVDLAAMQQAMRILESWMQQQPLSPQVLVMTDATFHALRNQTEKLESKCSQAVEPNGWIIHGTRIRRFETLRECVLDVLMHRVLRLDSAQLVLGPDEQDDDALKLLHKEGDDD